MTTLSTDEMARIRAELGDNVLSDGAAPYIGIRSVWAVIREYVESSATAATSASTAVTAAGPTSITVASVTGLSVGVRIQIDVDNSRETVTIRDVTGLVLSVICRKTHSGTYPVEIESPLTLVRGFLADLSGLEQVTSLESFNSLGLRRVDEIEWSERGQSALVESERLRVRRSLASALGLSWLASTGRPSSIEVY